MPHLARPRLLLAILWLVMLPGVAWAAHPQDGPHADVRIAIEDDVVRFSIGLNLAFIDEIVPPRRESLDAVAPSEIGPIRAGLEAFVREDNRVVIYGIEVPPDIKSFELGADPDPAGLALFPKTGMRALIRAVMIVEYPTVGPPQEIEFTWAAYPPDVLAEETEPGAELPAMVIEALLTADGKHKPLRFSEAQPTVTWSASESEGESLFNDVPVPPRPEPPETFPALSVGLGVIALVGVIAGVAGLARGRRPWIAGLVAVVFAVGALATRDIGRVPAPGTGSQIEPPSEQDAATVFRALHANLYRAFDYTDESDIYDALSRSVAGDELEAMYVQVFRSLVQAENDGMVGVVTGLEPRELEIAERRAEAVQGDAGARVTFKARHVWRVEGTVYHWGHSHTREHEYEGEYEVAALDEGWRIVDYRITRQTRLDPSGEPILEPSPVGEL